MIEIKDIKEALIESVDLQDVVHFGDGNQYWVEFITNGWIWDWYIEYGYTSEEDTYSVGKILITHYYENYSELFNGEWDYFQQWAEEILDTLLQNN